MRTDQSATFARLAQKLPLSPWTRAPARLLAVAAFGHLAPGIGMANDDLRYCLNLIEDMNRTLRMMAVDPEYPIAYRLIEEGDEQPAVEFYVPEGNVTLATAWIEFVHSPDAFFYWES